MSNEFDLIERIRARAHGPDPDVLLGIGDDAAVLLPRAGKALVATTDSLVAGRHFLQQWPAADIGHLSLAVNLSDIAAMGGTPRWALLSLTLPEADPVWLDAFLDGFLALAAATGTRLVGGNIARGPLNIGVQLLGEVAPDGYVARGAARPGDLILITGSLGDAAAALEIGAAADPALVQRLHRPQPRLCWGQRLADTASAMIDVSDGLLADLGHLLGAELGADLMLEALPASAALLAAVPEAEARWRLQLAGGNDYELLLTMGPERAQAVLADSQQMAPGLTHIGRVSSSRGLRCRRPDGRLYRADHQGWDHFGS